MFKDFDAAPEEESVARPTFRLAGRTFTAKRKLPYRVWMSLATVTKDDGPKIILSVNDFFRAVLLDEDVDRFFELLESDKEEDAVTIEQVTRLMGWLVEQYTGNQSGQPSDSQPGLPTTPTFSKRVSFSRGTVEAVRA